MEASKKLQLYFISLQHEHQSTKEEVLRKEISITEDELKTKSELIKKHELLIDAWSKESKQQLDKHIAELGRV
ncbi:Mediator of RNA polymerase II transcription subunit 28 [Apostasia shenzhenica]|uniref:Mediator of RNA polymerase II transcription subunit 28 n=1 Tax=Apostasia shenzhenica TaxID=1088818 RepID=A0A2I0AZD8_9ASPA|nr:Mediator of RNA polymerase II transcription subunit 28 [Apostasia shenzhenica]PKA62969.1 Mediator of RNA polymerase II transcription subunit 28 [Apostasia shenzhenica]